MLEKRQLKSTYCFKNLWNYLYIYSDRYLNTRIWGAKKLIWNTDYYLVLRYSEYRIWILLLGLTIQIVFKYRIICHTLALDTPPSFINKLNEGLTLFLPKLQGASMSKQLNLAPSDINSLYNTSKEILTSIRMELPYPVYIFCDFLTDPV